MFLSFSRDLPSGAVGGLDPDLRNPREYWGEFFGLKASHIDCAVKAA
jgi:hypothetical protein